MRVEKGGQGERYLIIGDNLSLAYVLGNGRASDLRLLGVCVTEMGSYLIGC